MASDYILKVLKYSLMGMVECKHWLETHSLEQFWKVPKVWHVKRMVYTTFQSSYWLGWSYLNGLIRMSENVKEINIWKPRINSGQSGHFLSHELCGGLLGRLV